MFRWSTLEKATPPGSSIYDVLSNAEVSPEVKIKEFAPTSTVAQPTQKKEARIPHPLFSDMHTVR